MTSFERLRATVALRMWTWRSIPLISWVRPRVVQMDAARCELCIPLTRRTRNHLGSMYFGALCIGADAAAALLGFRLIRERGARISFVFKDVRGEFLRRPEADVHFACEQGRELQELMDRAEASGERENLLVRIVATAPAISPEPVARFELTLSVKKRP